MIKDAWSTFVSIDINANEVCPIKRSPFNSHLFGRRGTLGVTLIDSLDTLIIADLMPEFETGLEWVKNHFHPEKIAGSISVFETTIRILGGLLSAYTLRGGNDQILLEKATLVGDLLLGAYNKEAKLFLSNVDLSSQIANGLSTNCVVLSECGTLSLEFEYLSKLTGDAKYANAIREQFDRITRRLYNDFIPINERTNCNGHLSLGASGDSFYEYLLKVYLLGNKKNQTQLDIYVDAMSSIEKELLRRYNDSAYFGVKDFGRFRNTMEHLACFSGGLYALAYNQTRSKQGTSDYWSQLAKDLTMMCRRGYESTSVHLGPEIFQVSPQGIPMPNMGSKHYILRPEYVESLFYLFRVTGDHKYREWAWDVVKALIQFCHVDTGGFVGLRDVYKTNSAKDDVQQSFFLSETLKYIYLIFCDENVLSLDHFVFNTEAHPFSIDGISK
ncbi:hypothetical protein ACOME3_001620 [Neoechinorhynchus agilis]